MLAIKHSLSFSSNTPIILIPEGGLFKSTKRKNPVNRKIYRILLRRERDSNPRYLSVRRFSRPVHSTTLPSLHRVFEIAVLAVKKVNHLKASLHCGERGIRTPGTSQYAGFQDRCIRPLCHLSIKCYGRHIAVLGKAICITFSFFAGAKVRLFVGFPKYFINFFQYVLEKWVKMCSFAV